jgi:hypothetical protein
LESPQPPDQNEVDSDDLPKFVTRGYGRDWELSRPLDYKVLRRWQNEMVSAAGSDVELKLKFQEVAVSYFYQWEYNDLEYQIMKRLRGGKEKASTGRQLKES